MRVEQYYPFPAMEVEAQLKKYPNAEVAWVQEEPKNMGAWSFIGPRIGEVMDAQGRGNRIRYVGRPEMASPAEGYMKLHTRSQTALIEDAMTLEATAAKQKKKA